MLRRTAWRAAALIAATAIGVLVVARGPGASASEQDASDPSVDDGAPEPAAPLHPIVIRHPETLGVVDTELRDVKGRPIGVSCDTCHASGEGEALARRAGAPKEFHAGVVLEHGTIKCASCHDPADRTRLRLADGTTLPVMEVMQLCQQCHGPQYRDFERGSHGGMAGYWDRTRGPQIRNNCVTCHSAHQPAYPRVVPAAPPRDRFLPRHPEPKPPVRLPGREPVGDAQHD